MNVDALCRENGIGDRVRERIVRLNPSPKQGEMLRGWHPKETARYFRFMCQYVTKREFIARHGRETWEKIKRSVLVKHDGRRKYVARVLFEDCER